MLEFELDVLGKAVGSDLKEKRVNSGMPVVVLEIVLFLLCGGVVFLFAGDNFSSGVLGGVLILLVVSLIGVPVFSCAAVGKMSPSTVIGKSCLVLPPWFLPFSLRCSSSVCSMPGFIFGSEILEMFAARHMGY